MRDHTDESTDPHSLELFDRYFLNSLPPADADSLRLALQKADIDLETIEYVRQLWQAPSHKELSSREWVERVTQHLGFAHDEKVSGHKTIAVDPSMHTKPRTNDKDGMLSVRTSEAFHASMPTLPVFRNLFGLKLRNLQYAMLGILAAALVLWTGWAGWTGWRLGSSAIKAELSKYTSTYTTANGQQATITLPDGSIVLLNVGSRLEIPTDYVTGNRTLALTGEALFTIRHSQATPFIVKAGSSATRVLGTTFVVRHYDTDSNTTVAVRSGKVAVGSTVLTAGHEAVINASGLVQGAPTTNDQFTFASGALTLHSTTLLDAIPQLNRWYDTDIRLGASTLGKQRVVGVFKSGSVADLVSILELTFDVRVVRDGRVLILYPRG